MKKFCSSLLLIVSLIAGCKERQELPKQHLRMSSLNELTSIDPQKSNDKSDNKILQAVFEGLIVSDPETMKPLPGVAERWTISADGKVYDFFLRENAIWSDGTPVIADDFVYAVRRALASRTNCPSPEEFFAIRNAKAFFERKVRNFDKVGVHAVNSKTLRIELEKRNPFFLKILMNPCWTPLNDRVVESFAQYAKEATQGGVLKLKIISNGPFLCAERIPGSCLLLQKNDKYWDAENVLLNSAVCFFLDSQISIEKDFAEDALDVAEVINDGRGIGEGGRYGYLSVAPTFDYVALLLNCSSPTLQNKDIRRALALSIDREKLLLKLHKSESLATRGFMLRLGQRFQSTAILNYSIQSARELFSNAGYADPSKFPEIRMLFSADASDNGENLIIAESIAEDWRKNLGISVHINFQDFDTFSANRKASNFDAAKIVYSGINIDPNSALKFFASKGLKNYSKWNSKAYEDIYDKADNAANKIEKIQLARAAEALLGEEMPVIPLFHRSHSYLISKKIEGWFPNPMNMHPLKFVYIKF